MKKFFEDFKAFAMRGNVIDMAVGVIIGAAFGSITTSLVNDIFMPLIGVLTGGINFGGLFIALDGGSYVSAEAAAAAGVGQGIVEACAGHIDYVEAMLASGSAQQINDMTAHLGALAFVRCRIADHGNGRIRM